MSTQRFFFLHVMKTAGWTLKQQILANFEREQVYPWEPLDAEMRTANFEREQVYPWERLAAEMLTANINLEYLTDLPASRRARIRVFTGHFPFVAVELLGEDLTTITILRDPVERTLSWLRAYSRSPAASRAAPQRKRIHDAHGALSLEEIYEDPFLFPCFIRDYQAKLFAFTVEDRPESHMDPLDVDASRLEIAKRNLERVHVIGTQDRFDELLSELEQRFGWRRAPVGNFNVGPKTPGDAPASFRRRIAEDNPADMEFFEHALRICEERRRATAVR
jgi:hypothetical protein